MSSGGNGPLCLNAAVSGRNAGFSPGRGVELGWRRGGGVVGGGDCTMSPHSIQIYGQDGGASLGCLSGEQKNSGPPLRALPKQMLN